MARLISTACLGAVVLITAGAHHPAAAQTGKVVRIDFENLTSGQALSSAPILSHREGMHLWADGQKASLGLQVLAEDGNTEFLLAEAVFGLGKDFGAAQAVIPTLPGNSRSTEISVTPEHPVVSAAWMLGMTNDGFAGFDAVDAYRLTEPLVIELHALDAGTEINDELKASLPALGSLGRTPENGVVHRHAGIRGGADAPDEWQFDPAEPVMRVTITPAAANN